MNSFSSDLDFSNKMSVLVDKKLQTITDPRFNFFNKINRLKGNKGKVHMLDQMFAIDGIVETKNGMLFTFQEKIRRNKFKSFNDFTLEYYSNAENKTKWEFFHLAADFYFHWYANESENNIDIFRIIDIKRLKYFVDKNFNILIKNNLRQNIQHSKANFFSISFDILEKEWIVIYKS